MFTDIFEDRHSNPQAPSANTYNDYPSNKKRKSQDSRADMRGWAVGAREEGSEAQWCARDLPWSRDNATTNLGRTKNDSACRSDRSSTLTSVVRRQSTSQQPARKAAREAREAGKQNQEARSMKRR